jgi:hypothetical protein
MPPTRRLFIALPPDAYRLLERLARAQERLPERQASWLLRERLAELGAAATGQGQDDAVVA